MRQFGDENYTYSKEEIDKKNQTTKTFEPRLALAFPSLRIKANGEDGARWIKLLPAQTPEEENPFVVVLAVHKFDNKLYLCPGDVCRETPEMPCFRARRIWQDPQVKAHKKVYFEERKKWSGTAMTRELFDELAGKIEVAFALGAQDWHIYNVVDCTHLMRNGAIKGKWKDCWGDYAARNDGQTDEECAQCPAASSCQAKVYFYDAHYTNDAKSTAKKIYECWHQSEDRAKSCYRTVAGKDGFVHSKLIKFKLTPGATKDDYPTWSFDISDEEASIPKHVMEKVVEDIGDRDMEELILRHMRIPNEQLIEKAKQQVDFPLSEKKAADGPAAVPEDDTDPWGLNEEKTKLPEKKQASPARPTSASAPGKTAPSGGGAKSTPATTSAAKAPSAPSEETGADDKIIRLINDPVARTDRFDEKLKEKIPVCLGFYHADWPKCSPELDETHLCPLIEMCQMKTTLNKAKPKAVAPAQEAPAAPKEAPAKSKPAPEPEPPQEAPEASEEPSFEAQAKAWMMKEGLDPDMLPPCFGDSDLYRPGKGKNCLKCQQDHAKIVKFCGAAVQAATA